jgi:hypothetical protein
LQKAHTLSAIPVVKRFESTSNTSSDVSVTDGAMATRSAAVSLGINIPLSVECNSRIAFGLGVVMPMPTLFCALEYANITQQSADMKSLFFMCYRNFIICKSRV